MNTVKSTACVEIKDITLTPGENYSVAQGTANFAGDEVTITAYGRAAEELAANQNSHITAEIEILGGSRNAQIKLNRIVSVAAPAIQVADERIEEVRKTLASINSKMTKKQLVAAVEGALAVIKS